MLRAQSRISIGQDIKLLFVNCCTNEYNDDVVLKRYHLGPVLGKGCFGVVLMAYAYEEGKFAIKIISKHVEAESDKWVVAEHVVVSHLIKYPHPCIVTCYEVIDSAKHIYIVMELVMEGTLDHYRKQPFFDGIEV